MTQVRRPVFPIVVLIAVITISRAQAPQAGADPRAIRNGQAHTAGTVEVLTDTQGVDFGPYLTKVVQQIRKNWYNFIPEQARPPQLAAGVTSIEFVILPTGQVSGMKIAHQSGMYALDRAAWGGITASLPFDPLPKKFKGNYLALRFNSAYNPTKPQDKSPDAPPANSTGEEPK